MPRPLRQPMYASMYELPMSELLSEPADVRAADVRDAKVQAADLPSSRCDANIFENGNVSIGEQPQPQDDELKHKLDGDLSRLSDELELCLARHRLELQALLFNFHRQASPGSDCTAQHRGKDGQDSAGTEERPTSQKTEPLARISTPSPRRRTVIGCSFSSQKAASQVSARDTLIEQLELQVQSQQLQLQQLQQQQKQQQASCNYSSNSSNSTAESDAPRGQVHCYADQHLLQGAAATCSSDEEKSSWRFMVAAMKKHLLDDKQVDVLSKFDQLAEENEALLADKFEARLQLDDKMNDCELEKLLKPSMKVRELRASEKALAMQQRYSEAEQLKSEANSIEQEEFARKAVVFYEGPAAWRAFATQQDHTESWKALQRDLCVDFEKLVYEGHLPSP